MDCVLRQKEQLAQGMATVCTGCKALLLMHSFKQLLRAVARQSSSRSPGKETGSERQH